MGILRHTPEFKPPEVSVAEAEEQIRNSGGRLVVIETSTKPGYEKTRHFYLNHGYEIICRIPDFYAPGDDKIILQKRVNQRPGLVN